MRRTLALRGALVAVVATIAIVFGVGAAGADPGNGNGAVVQHNAYGPITCSVTDGLGGFWLIDNCTANIVTTPDGTVNESLKGTVDPLTPPPSSAFTGSTATTGQGCDPTSGALDIVNEVITPSGHFSAKCSSS
jgi:hypothetical protein